MEKKVQKGFRIVFLVFLVFLVAVPCSRASDKKAELKVYQRFFKATGAEAQYNQILNLMTIQLQRSFSAVLKEATKKTDSATPEEKKKSGSC
jgi:hypothetical protein